MGSGRYARSDPIGATPRIEPYVYVGGNPLKSSDPLGLFKIDDSCNCFDPDDARHPGNKLGKTIVQACSYLKKPGCREALKSHGLEDCYLKTCGPPLIGHGPKIICRQDPSPCGFTNPFTDDIVLYSGHKADCPRFKWTAHGPTGPRDFSQTLFHEIGHTCNVPGGNPEPSWWQEVQRICTGWPL